jgi:transposase
MKNQSQAIPKTIVGVDISKDRLDFSLDGQSVEFLPNTPTDCLNLAVRLAELTPQPLVLAEPTGGYEKTLLAASGKAGLSLSLVHASRVRAFAHASGIEAKTDHIDAKLLWLFGQNMPTPVHAPPSESESELRQLLEYRSYVVDRKSELQTRVETASPLLASCFRRDLAHCEKEIRKVDVKIQSTIASDPLLKERSVRLQQVNGVGPVLSAVALAFMPELGSVTDKCAASLAGVCPITRQSGASKGTASIRGGRSIVRNVLYMAATCAIRHNAILSVFYQRLIARNKPKKVALVAVMRKLLVLLNRIIADPSFSPSPEPSKA